MHTVLCDYCGSEVKKKKLYKNSFCNRLCRAEWQKEKYSKKVTVSCNACGCNIERTQKQLRSSKTGLYFCSNDCKNPYIARNCRDQSSNPNSYRKRRERILEKTKYSCVGCGYNKDKRMLDIHHINGNHQDNRVENLTPVCVWCHQKYHRLGVEIGSQTQGGSPVLGTGH